MARQWKRIEAAPTVRGQHGEETMEAHGSSGEFNLSEPLKVTARTVKPKGRRGGSSPDRQGAATAVQVSITVPRDVVASFDRLSSQTGVNRAHLMREALGMYAALLASGHRVYEVPGLARRAG